MITKGITYFSYRALYPVRNIRRYFIFRVLDPLIHYAFFSLISMAILGRDYQEYVIVGSIVYSVAQVMIVNQIIMFRYERLYGTLELNIAVPTSIFNIIRSRLIISIIDAFFVTCVGIFHAFVFFGITLHINEILPFLCFITVIIFSISAFALVLASFSLVLSNPNLLLNISLGIILIFCGTNFPITLLPGVLPSLARLLPITNGLLGLRNIYKGQGITENLQYLANELLVGVFYFIAAIVLIRVMEYFSRKSAALFED